MLEKVGLSVLLQAGLPPANVPFIVAAFVVTGVALLTYGLYVFRRRREAEREVLRLKDDGRHDGPGG